MAQELGLRSGQFHRTEAQVEKRNPFSRCACRQHDSTLFDDGHGLAGRIQAGSIRLLSIMHTASDHMELLFRALA